MRRARGFRLTAVYTKKLSLRIYQLTIMRPFLAVIEIARGTAWMFVGLFSPLKLQAGVVTICTPTISIKKFNVLNYR
jgi:hypothetical protein